MSRTLVEVFMPDGGSVGIIVPTLELDRMDWTEYLLPLAELVAARHPGAVWMAKPIADDIDDRKAMGVG